MGGENRQDLNDFMQKKEALESSENEDSLEKRPRMETIEEQWKMQKRQRKKEAAEKSRLKKKAKFDELQDENQLLQQDNYEYKKMVEALERYNKQLEKKTMILKNEADKLKKWIINRHKECGTDLKMEDLTEEIFERGPSEISSKQEGSSESGNDPILLPPDDNTKKTSKSQFPTPGLVKPEPSLTVRNEAAKPLTPWIMNEPKSAKLIDELVSIKHELARNDEVQDQQNNETIEAKLDSEFPEQGFVAATPNAAPVQASNPQMLLLQDGSVLLIQGDENHQQAATAIPLVNPVLALANLDNNTQEASLLNNNEKVNAAIEVLRSQGCTVYIRSQEPQVVPSNTVPCRFLHYAVGRVLETRSVTPNLDHSYYKNNTSLP